jgi:tRNA-Thr(GGU) m(6)t(6)A37 methyltransferase TsaA
MNHELSDVEKLRVLFDYWLRHNIEHIDENERWLQKVKDIKLDGVAHELEAVVRLSKEINHHIEHARDNLDRETEKTSNKEEKGKSAETETIKVPHQHIELHSIGIIHTPYTDRAPRQPQPDAEGDFRIVVDDRWADALYRLDEFKYICVFFHLHRAQKEVPTRVSPRGSSDKHVGVFASRSPGRPNPIGFSVVGVKKIVKNTIFISGIDVFDGTPLLDIKPYIGSLDCKSDASSGWIDEFDESSN